jgi:hypothetical protein
VLWQPIRCSAGATADVYICQDSYLTDIHIMLQWRTLSGIIGAPAPHKGLAVVEAPLAVALTQHRRQLPLTLIESNTRP